MNTPMMFRTRVHEPVKDPRAPADVTLLVLHAKDALVKGNVAEAESLLELALRRCET